jgi:hypothetical protein
VVVILTSNHYCCLLVSKISTCSVWCILLVVSHYTCLINSYPIMNVTWQTCYKYLADTIGVMLTRVSSVVLNCFRRLMITFFAWEPNASFAEIDQVNRYIGYRNNSVICLTVSVQHAIESTSMETRWRLFNTLLIFPRPVWVVDCWCVLLMPLSLFHRGTFTSQFHHWSRTCAMEPCLQVCADHNSSASRH